MSLREQLEIKIRNYIPELKKEYETFNDGSLDKNMITPIMLNHVLEYTSLIKNIKRVAINNNGGIYWSLNIYSAQNPSVYWNLKSTYLKDQGVELITFLNELN